MPKPKSPRRKNQVVEKLFKQFHTNCFDALLGNFIFVNYFTTNNSPSLSKTTTSNTIGQLNISSYHIGHLVVSFSAKTTPVIYVQQTWVYSDPFLAKIL